MSAFLSLADPATVVIPELLSPDDSEQTATAVFVVLALDGADQFCVSHPEKWDSKVQPFRDIVRQVINELAGDLRSVLTGRYPDAEFARFVGQNALRDATAAMACVLRRLADWNTRHQLNWIDQLHARVGLSTESWAGAVCLLQQAQRDEVIVDPVDWSSLNGNEQVSLGVGMNIRQGADEATWKGIVKQLTEGIEFPSDSYVVKKFSKFAIRNQELEIQLLDDAAAATG